MWWGWATTCQRTSTIFLGSEVNLAVEVGPFLPLQFTNLPRVEFQLLAGQWQDPVVLRYIPCTLKHKNNQGQRLSLLAFACKGQFAFSLPIVSIAVGLAAKLRIVFNYYPGTWVFLSPFRPEKRHKFNTSNPSMVQFCLLWTIFCAVLANLCLFFAILSFSFHVF